MSAICCTVPIGRFADIRSDMQHVDVLIEISECSCLKTSRYEVSSDCPYLPYLYRVLPSLLEEMDVEDGNVALQSVYHMCDNRNRHNRIPMLACPQFDVVDRIANRIARESSDGLDIALLLLNNLAIPLHNKAVIMSCASAGKLLDALCNVMNRDVPETLLGCICLVNLTIFQENAELILNHTRTPEENTLLRILEKLLELKSPELTTPVEVSVEKETTRWACKLAMNLCACENNANALSFSRIPLRILELLRNSNLTPLCLSIESIEESALRALRAFAEWPILRRRLVEVDAVSVVRRFTGRSDQKDYRSYEILTLLGEDHGTAYSDCLFDDL